MAISVPLTIIANNLLKFSTVVFPVMPLVIFVGKMLALEINQVLKRNTTKFPNDYLIELASDEWNPLKSQFVTSKNEKVQYD